MTTTTSQHTEGRLTVRDATGRLWNTDSKLPAIFDHDGCVAECYDADDAHRLAASYNACLSVPLDQLERLDVGRLVEVIEEVRHHLHHVIGVDLTREIDELRAALGDTE